MKYLVHCILRKQAGLPAVRPAAQTAGVTFIESGNLAAAVTLCDRETAPVETAQLLAYERAISYLHAGGPVIPLRYGCLVEDAAAVLRLLEEHRAEYEALLERLDDRIEMGLRVLWDAPEDIPQAPGAAAPAPPTPGAAYLAAARRRHSPAADLTLAEREWAGGICAALSDLFSEERREAQFAGPGRLVSLYFLVPRPAVRRFRTRLRRIVACQGRGFLVSGPWPPYNFVIGAASRARSHLG